MVSNAFRHLHYTDMSYKYDLIVLANSSKYIYTIKCVSKWISMNSIKQRKIHLLL